MQENYFGDDGYSSDESWEKADDVFPEAEAEYKIALLLKEGKASLAALFGETLDLTDVNVNELKAPGSDEELKDDDDEDFDDEETSDRDSSGNRSSSTRDSDGTESVCGARIKEELAALSSADEDNNSSNDIDADKMNKTQIRGRKRARIDYKKLAGEDSSDSSDDSSTDNRRPGERVDPGKFDVNNIVIGKRKRKTVDYPKLNKQLFGDAPGSVGGQTMDQDTDEYTQSDDRDATSRSGTDSRSNSSSSESEDSGDSSSKESDQEDVDDHDQTNGLRSDDVPSSATAKHGQRLSADKPNAAADHRNRKTKEFKDKENYCTCKKSKCLKLYCACFSNERSCMEGVCKCKDCGNRNVAVGDNNTERTSQRAVAAQQTPHELLLALKNEGPVAETEDDEYSRQQASSPQTADDLPGLLLSLKNRENSPSYVSPLDGKPEPSSYAKLPAVGSSNYRNPVRSPPFPLPGFGNKPLTGTFMSPGSGVLSVKCSCRKSNCLKLYCFCMAQGKFCGDFWYVGWA